MNLPSFAEFEARARVAGFDEVVERRWPPRTVLATHTHDVQVDALVTQGEMWWGRAEGTQHLRPGERFTLQRQVPHDERCGPEGATCWVARRNAV